MTEMNYRAFFDANYHDYRFIDRENADSGTFNYVKGIFDKINTLSAVMIQLTIKTCNLHTKNQTLLL